jgi:hypothetical protein
MEQMERSAGNESSATQVAILVLLVLTGVMLMALFSRTAPHPPLEVAPFALAPFLGASLAIGTAAFQLDRHGSRVGSALAILFAVTALVSFGPQKYIDPAFSRIWPAVISAQVAIMVIAVSATRRMIER